MDLNRLWIATPLIPIGTILVAALVTGKTINPLRGMRPLIVNRSEHPRRFWGGVVGSLTMFLVWGWLSFKVFTMAGA